VVAGWRQHPPDMMELMGKLAAQGGAYTLKRCSHRGARYTQSHGDSRLSSRMNRAWQV